jgi:hypothetical protein
MNRRSQYSRADEDTVRKSQYNDYMSPDLKPMSPRNNLPPKYSTGKMQNTAGSPSKPMN